MSTNGHLSAAYWSSRIADVGLDLLRSQLSQRPSARADAEALQRYVMWMQGKMAMKEAE